MKYRYAVVLAAGDLGISGTKIVDIDVADPISRLSVLFQPVGGSNAAVAHPAAAITKLELVDGSDVLFSMSGYEAQALNILQAVKPHPQVLHYFTGGTPQVPFHLDFGRYLWDEELALDPKQFTNLQLKITWNEVLWDASCDTHNISVYGFLFDEKVISPIGYLMKKEIKAYTPVSDAYEYTDLPRDYAHRGLFIQGFCSGGGLRGLVKEVKLDEDNEKRVIIDGDVDVLRNILDPLWGDAVDTIIATVAATSTILFCTGHNHNGISCIVDVADKAIGGRDLSGGKFWVESEGAGLGNLKVRGKNPHGVMGIPFGNQMDYADWYDVTNVGKLRLRIQGGPNSASTYTNRIVCEQFRPY